MDGTPNALAYVALLLCPVVSIVLVALVRPAVSVPIVILAGQMFLPPTVELNIPILHPTKDIIPAISALIGCLIFRPKTLARCRPGRGYDLFIVLQMVGFLGTTLTNRVPLFYGPKALQGLTYYDAFVGAVHAGLYWWPPFFLGRALYRTARDLRKLLVLLAIAGVVYSLFLIVEMVMSPQLNRWIYGFHQTEFLQTIRGGGYRPKAFMRHGLNVALFMLFTVFASVTLAKAKRHINGVNATIVAIYLCLVLVFCRSVGALVYAGVFLPLLVFFGPRNQTRFVAIVAVVLFAYPLVRAVGLVPIEGIRDLAASQFGGERAGSLAMRLEQEGVVMERALSRIAFGWGGYSRAFRHDTYSGKNLTVIDGLWAIQIGTQGAVGYVSLFGMLLLPVWRARKTIARLSAPRDQALVSCLAIMAASFTMDLIPNSSIDPYLTFLVGVLVGTERGFDPTPPNTVASHDPPMRERSRPIPIPSPR